jgi:phage terminase small subunit
MTEGIKTKLKIEASLHALSGLLSNPNIIKYIDMDNQEYMDKIAVEATSYADTLIAQLEEEGL